MKPLSLLSLLSALLVAFLVQCTGTESKSGFGEPIRVRNGVFKRGALPGATSSPLTITAIETSSTVLRPGQGEKTLGGRASVGATSVAIALAGFGTGYWVIGVDGPDPLNNGELGWQAIVEVARDAPIGPKDLLIVPIDAAGNAGTQRALPVCVPRAVPDNLNACNPASAPPAAVVTLTWDTAVDLDLVVVAPDGRVIDAKHPRAAAALDAGAGDAGGASSPTPFIDRDSNAACSLDRVQQESLVFPEAPSPGSGSYLVFANVFDACDQATVHFKVAIETRTTTVVAGANAFALEETDSRAGTLTSLDANGGASLGTFVLEAAF